MPDLFPLEVAYQSGQHLYVVISDTIGGDAVWRTDTKVFESYNPSNWASYAIALTEQGVTGYYRGVYPPEIYAAIGSIMTTERPYVRGGGSPVAGDSPAAQPFHSQGANIAGIGGDTVVPSTLQRALKGEAIGKAAGSPTTSQIPTDLGTSQANAYQGRAVVFTTGAAAGCAGRIIAYAVSGGVLTLAAPLAVAPSADDEFVIF